MVPAKHRSCFCTSFLYQRSQSGEHASHVISCDLLIEVTISMMQYKLNFFIQRFWFEGNFVNRSISGSENNLIMPRNCKQNTLVICFWYHQCIVPGKKFFI